MKQLFILARARRSVDTLEDDLRKLASSMRQSFDEATCYGDLVFWPVRAISGTHRRIDHTREFWQEHRAALESGLLSEIVIGEIGNSMFSAAYCDHIDTFQGCDHLYGNPPDSDNRDEHDPYEGRLFFTIDTQEWFDEIAPEEDDGFFRRKLLILIGRNPDHRFLDSRVGQRLRARLGSRAKVVFSANNDDVAVIAFEHGAAPSDLFELIKGLLPPRLVLDFLITDIGGAYCTGDAPISLFADWAEQPSRREIAAAKAVPAEKDGPRQVIVEKRRRRPSPPRPFE